MSTDPTAARPVPAIDEPAAPLPDSDAARRVRRSRQTATGTALEVVEHQPVPAEVALGRAEADVAVARYQAMATAANTHATYGSAWKRFEAWCAEHGHPALPASPQTVARYFATHADQRRDDGEPRYKASTFTTWNAAIGWKHNQQGYTHPGRHPTVAAPLKGIRADRAEQGQTVRKAAALTTEPLQLVVTAIHSGAHGWRAEVAARRDIALLVLGFAGGLRRSELGRLQFRDLLPAGDAAPDALEVRLRRSKGSQTSVDSVFVVRGQGSALWCPWCAVLRWRLVVAAYDTAALGVHPDGVGDDATHAGEIAVRRLLRRERGIDVHAHVCRAPWPRTPREKRALFRALDRGTPRVDRGLTGVAINTVVRRRAMQAGLDPVLLERISAHSLRSGPITEAYTRGATTDEVMNFSRHKNPETARRYDRNPRHIHTAARKLGL
jgi:integrase